MVRRLLRAWAGRNPCSSACLFWAVFSVVFSSQSHPPLFSSNYSFTFPTFSVCLFVFFYTFLFSFFLFPPSALRFPVFRLPMASLRGQLRAHGTCLLGHTDCFPMGFLPLRYLVLISLVLAPRTPLKTLSAGVGGLLSSSSSRVQ